MLPKSTRLKYLALAALPLLAACDVSDAPAPYYNYGQRGGATSAGFHTASSGDTLYEISQRYGIAMPDIIAANNLQAPYKLTPGQRIKLPPPRIYNVKPGDTLYNVARVFGVSESDVARQNNLSAPFKLTSGAQLRIPSDINNLQPAASANSFYLPPPAPGNEMPPPRLALAGHVDREVLSSPAGMAAQPYAPAPQQQARQVRYQWNYGLPHYDARNEVPGANRGIGAPRDGFSPPPAQFSPQGSTYTPPTPTLSASAGYIWPVEGRVVSGFGSAGDGIHNDGIDIGAARGAPVRCAANGTVVYAGRHLRGYGNLVLVRHPDGWVTAYAHMQKLMVSKGQQVAQGDTIGTVGSTGSVSSDQLHFEIRRGTEALDPVKYLNRRTT